ncbi:hypothetical protein GmHk_20G059195 [Glycine max]|nr:hypothetical protein GmHk_20G059195 [Glycine max]
MVRIRGLRRTLDRILGRVLGRQCRRPTTSARRQRAAATIAEDVDHGDHATDKVHEQPQEPITNHVGVDTEGFPGRPHDTSMLTHYVDHVAAREHTKLKLTSHRRKVEKFERFAPEIEGIMVARGLSSLITCSVDTSDMRLLYAFAEGFHLPVGDVTITLNDVASLLHLSITSVFHTFNALDYDSHKLTSSFIFHLPITSVFHTFLACFIFFIPLTTN